MKSLLTYLLLFFVATAAAQIPSDIILTTSVDADPEVLEEEICWSVNGVDSSLTRFTYVDPSDSTQNTVLFYVNAMGQVVSVSGGTLSLGFCGCCIDPSASASTVFYYSNDTLGADYSLPVDTLEAYDFLYINLRTDPADAAVLTLPDVGIGESRGKTIIAFFGGRELDPGDGVVTCSSIFDIWQINCKEADTTFGADTVRADGTNPRILVYRTTQGYGDDYYRECQSVSEIAFDSNREILRMWEVGDNIGGSTVGDFLEYLYFAPPTLSSTIIGGTVFEVGTSNTVTFRSTLSNPAATNITNYLITEQTEGTQATLANGNPVSRTDDFQFTYTPVQSPVGGVGVWDAQSYNFRSTADYALGADAGSVQSPFRQVQGIYPVLYGMVADTATAFADPYGTMTKLVQTEGNKTVSYTGTGLIFYGFPQTWADTNLSSIIDPNGFNVTSSFTRVTYPVVTSTGLTDNYTSVPYVFYFLNTGSTTTSSSNYTFNR
jgi:hypothetical protein